VEVSPEGGIIYVLSLPLCHRPDVFMFCHSHSVTDLTYSLRLSVKEWGGANPNPEGGYQCPSNATSYNTDTVSAITLQDALTRTLDVAQTICAAVAVTHCHACADSSSVS
jgi:hypothetical protein